MWNNIITEFDAKLFMESVYYFHDSCIKEIHYYSGAYVDTNLSMYPINARRSLRVIIQRQFEKMSALELDFIGLKYLNLYPNDEHYTCEILDSTMIITNDNIYWCDLGGLSEVDLSNYQGTLICASKLRWRPIDCLGAEDYL